MTDKLILVTRKDLTPAQQAVQSAHALRAFVADYPEQDQLWYRTSNTLALLSVHGEDELLRLCCRAEDAGVRYSTFCEPDMDDALTAIALEPGAGSRRLTRSLPLALR